MSDRMINYTENERSLWLFRRLRSKPTNHNGEN